jgi:hypothetical protein
MLGVSLGELAEAGFADLALLDAAHLAVGDPQAAGDVMVGFGADEFQPGLLIDLRARCHMDDDPALACLRYVHVKTETQGVRVDSRSLHH